MVVHAMAVLELAMFVHTWGLGFSVAREASEDVRVQLFLNTQHITFMETLYIVELNQIYASIHCLIHGIPVALVGIACHSLRKGILQIPFEAHENGPPKPAVWYPSTILCTEA